MRDGVGNVLKSKTIEALLDWGSTMPNPHKKSPLHPARVVMQDFNCVPALFDLAACATRWKSLGGDPATKSIHFPRRTCS